MVRGRLLANMLWMAVWQASNYLIPLLSFPYLTRVLGSGAYGDFSFAFALMTFLLVIADWGFDLSATGDIARNQHDHDVISRIFWHTLVSKAAIAALCTFALIIGILLAQPAARQTYALLAATSHLWASVLTLSWCLKGLERMGRFTTATIIGRLITLPLIFFFVHGPDDAWAAVLIIGMGGALGGAFSIVMVARLGILRRPAISAAGVWRQISGSWTLFVSTISASLYTNTAAVFLGLISGSTSVGIFAAADRLRTAAQSATGPITHAVYPHSARLMHENRQAGLKFARKLLVGQSLVCAGVSLALFIGANILIDVLAGPQFAQSVVVLQILSPMPLLTGITNVLGMQLMIPLGMRSAFSKIMLFVCLANLVIITPMAFMYGPIGAAATALTAETLALVMMAARLRGIGFFSGFVTPTAAAPEGGQ